MLPALGRRPLDRLTVEDLDLFYATLLTEGRKPTKRLARANSAGLRPKTVRNIHLMLNKAMADAQRKGFVVRNVVALADAPSLKSVVRKQHQGLGRCSAPCRSSTRSGPTGSIPHSISSAHTGMRRGEVLGLRWCDLDLDAGRLSVRQALVAIAYDGARSPT